MSQAHRKGHQANGATAARIERSQRRQEKQHLENVRGGLNAKKRKRDPEVDAEQDVEAQEVQEAEPLPQRHEDRSTTAPPVSVEPPQALAKTFTPSEARQIIDSCLQRPVTEEFEVWIVGTTDLVTHNWSEKARRIMLGRQQMSDAEKRLAKKNREPKNPEEDFQGARYHWDGKDWFPANGVKKSIVQAGFGLGIPVSITNRCLWVCGDTLRDYVEIRYKRVEMREDPVRVGPFNKRETDLRYRPGYKDWAMLLRVTVRKDILSVDKALALIEHAGLSIGIGEWRNDRGGQYGSYAVARPEDFARLGIKNKE